jgi:hypothetical protein
MIRFYFHYYLRRRSAENPVIDEIKTFQLTERFFRKLFMKV